MIWVICHANPAFLHLGQTNKMAKVSQMSRTMKQVLFAKKCAPYYPPINCQRTSSCGSPFESFAASKGSAQNICTAGPEPILSFWGIYRHQTIQKWSGKDKIIHKNHFITMLLGSKAKLVVTRQLFTRNVKII